MALPGTLSPLGAATVQLLFVHPIDQSGNTIGATQVTIGAFFNKLDSITFSGTVPVGGNSNVAVSVTGATGAYSGASGSGSFTLAASESSPNVSLTGSANVTVSGKTTGLTLQANVATPPGHPDYQTDFSIVMGNGTVSPIGSVTFTANLSTIQFGSQTGRTQGNFVFNFNTADSVTVFINIPPGGPSNNIGGAVVGGTGAYAGASGNFSVNFDSAAGAATLSGGGTITVPAPGTPIVTSVTTSYGAAATAGNVWLEVKGTNLVPANTPAGGVTWSNAPEFASGQMPTQLNGISAKVNNNAAYIYFYCSAATTPACASDQINILAPFDGFYGQAPVTVTNATGTSRNFILPHQYISPSLLLFNAKGYIAATHADFSLIGPATLYPGASTPAKTLETVLLYAVGFGLPSTPLASGSSTQAGPLPELPICYIGLNQATVVSPANVISPGLYQLNVVIPTGTPSGDNLVTCSYQANSPNRISTPPGALITVQ